MESRSIEIGKITTSQTLIGNEDGKDHFCIQSVGQQVQLTIKNASVTILEDIEDGATIALSETKNPVSTTYGDSYTDGRGNTFSAIGQINTISYVNRSFNILGRVANNVTLSAAWANTHITIEGETGDNCRVSTDKGSIGWKYWETNVFRSGNGHIFTKCWR